MKNNTLHKEQVQGHCPSTTREQFHRTYSGEIKQTDFSTGFHTVMTYVANRIAKDHIFDNYCKTVQEMKEQLNSR